MIIEINKINTPPVISIPRSPEWSFSGVILKPRPNYSLYNNISINTTVDSPEWKVSQKITVNSYETNDNLNLTNLPDSNGLIVFENDNITNYLSISFDNTVTIQSWNKNAYIPIIVLSNNNIESTYVNVTLQVSILHELNVSAYTYWCDTRTNILLPAKIITAIHTTETVHTIIATCLIPYSNTNIC